MSINALPPPLDPLPHPQEISPYKPLRKYRYAVFRHNDGKTPLKLSSVTHEANVIICIHIV